MVAASNNAAEVEILLTTFPNRRDFIVQSGHNQFDLFLGLASIITPVVESK